jgi:hypothetical protein
LPVCGENDRCKITDFNANPVAGTGPLAHFLTGWEKDISSVFFQQKRIQNTTNDYCYYLSGNRLRSSTK